MSHPPKHKPRPATRPPQNPSGGYWLYGTHAVTQALANPRRRVTRLLMTPAAAARGDLPGTMKPERVEPAYLDRTLPEGAVHQGVAALVAPLPDLTLEDILETATTPLVLLDQVTDPHNVGAILRSAAAFNAAAVILPKDHSPPETAVLAKSASGALEIIPLVRVTNLVQAMELIKKAGYWCAGLDGSANQPIHQAKLGQKTALVLGAEGKGLRRLTAEHCDLMVRLPISPQMESLNVSNAAAVALYELGRG